MRRSAVGALALATISVGGIASAQDPTRAPEAPRLYLTGKATLEAPPDFAAVSIGVSNKAATTGAAIDQTSASAAKIVESARTFGIAPRDVQTSSLSLQPAYRTVRDGNGNVEQRPDGYTASNTVTIRVRDLGRLGEFLRTVVDGGANRIGGVEFGLADPSRLEREAIAAAVKDARAQADTIATAAGIRLGRIEQIRYGASQTASPMPRRTYRSVAPAAAPPVPVEAGSLDVSAEVEMVFAIEPS